MSLYSQRRTRIDPFQKNIIQRPQGRNDLQVRIGGSIVQGYELVVSEVPDPAHHYKFLVEGLVFKDFNDFGPFVEHCLEFQCKYIQKQRGDSWAGRERPIVIQPCASDQNLVD